MINVTGREVCLFVEAENYVLQLPVDSQSQVRKWGIPGGKIASDEKANDAALRILKEQTGLDVTQEQLKSYGQHRFDKSDPTVDVFSVVLPDGKKVEGAKWVSMYGFKSDSQGELAFKAVFGDRVWQKYEASDSKILAEGTQGQQYLGVIKKGAQPLLFNRERPIFITWVGLPKSGKKTQAQKLENLFGIKSISPEDLVRKEFKDKTAFALEILKPELAKCGDNIDILPPEVLYRMLARRLHDSDCQFGCSMRGFSLPGEQTTTLHSLQAETFHSLIARTQALCITIFLNVSEDVARTRKGSDASFESHYENFKSNEMKILRALGERSHVISLDLTNESEDEVFHQVLTEINDLWDEELKKKNEKTIEQEPQGAPKPQSSNLGMLTLGMAVGAAAALVGAYFFNQAKSQ